MPRNTFDDKLKLIQVTRPNHSTIQQINKSPVLSQREGLVKDLGIPSLDISSIDGYY